MSTRSDKSKPGARVRVMYDPVSDEVDVLWGEPIGSMEPTDDPHVMERLDYEGNTIGFSIRKLKRLDENKEIDVELGLPRAGTLLPIRAVAERLGVSDRRLRQLITEGRVKGAQKVGQDWWVRTPIEILPGTRGQAGVAKMLAGVPASSRKAVSAKAK